MKKLLLLSLVVLQTYADVHELDLTHENNFESNQVSNSVINQGLLEVEDSILSSSSVHTQNRVRNTNLDGYSLIEQSTIKLLNGSDVEESDIDLISYITNSDMDMNSSVIQNSLLFDNAFMTASSIMSHTQIDNVSATDSTIRQSSIALTNDSRVENGSSFHLKSVIENLDSEKSMFSQSEIFINDSTLNGVDIMSSNRFSSSRGTLKIANAMVVQGSHHIDRSSLTNSSIKSDTIMVDTTVRDAAVDICSTYINGATLSNVDIEKYCSMEESKISNGAILYQGITRID